MTFSERMRESTATTWDAAVRHRFVDELWSGELDRAVLTRYLVQDHQFVDAFLALLGGAVAHADRPAPRRTLARQLGLLVGPEHDFFDRSLAALDAIDERPERLAPTAGFVDLMNDARDAGYADALAVLTVAEWLYQDWADRPGTPLPSNPIHAEWIELHRGAEFADWVRFLRDELDRVAADLSPEAAERAGARFTRAVALELAFFDAAYG